MICTNNVVAACTTVGLKNSEGIVMRKVFKPICVLLDFICCFGSNLCLYLIAEFTGCFKITIVSGF